MAAASIARAAAVGRAAAGGAPAAHAPLVVSVTACTTCHKGMTAPHAELVRPTLTATLARGEFLHAVTGGLSIPWVPLVGVTGYVQHKAADAADWTDLVPIATNAGGFYSRLAAPGFDYRSISEGVAGPSVIMPAFSVAPVKRPFPILTLRRSGFSDHHRGYGSPPAREDELAALPGEAAALTSVRRQEVGRRSIAVADRRAAPAVEAADANARAARTPGGRVRAVRPTKGPAAREGSGPVLAPVPQRSSASTCADKPFAAGWTTSVSGGSKRAFTLACTRAGPSSELRWGTTSTPPSGARRSR